MGATLHFHYCMGVLTSWGLIDHESKACSVCAKPDTSGTDQQVGALSCCQDEHKQLKGENDQRITVSDFLYLKITPAVLELKRWSSATSLIFSVRTDYSRANAPPGTGKPPAFLLNRNFRI